MLRLVPLLALVSGCLFDGPTDYRVSWSTAVRSSTVPDQDVLTYVDAAHDPWRDGYEGSMLLTYPSGHDEAIVCAHLVYRYTTTEEQFGHSIQVEMNDWISEEQCKTVDLDAAEPAAHLDLVVTR